MVIWPWSRFDQLVSALLDANRLNVQLTHRAEISALNLRTAERDLERLSNEHHALQADFKHLVAQTAGRVPSRHGQLDPDVFERDPFVENPKIPSEWLTDDPEELLDRGESEAGVPGRPSESEGDPGASVA